MRLKVMQWNVWCKEEPKRVAEVIREYQPDIVTAQELIEYQKHDTVVSSAQIIADILSYEYLYTKAQTYPGDVDKVSEGVAIFSRLKILNHQTTLILPDTKRHAHPYGRKLLEVTLGLPGGLCQIATTHLTFIPGFEHASIRTKELIKLERVLRTKQRKYIFSADLNSLPDSQTVKSITAHLNQVTLPGNGFTFPTKPFYKNGPVVSDLKWQLDYVFVSKDVKVTKAEIIKTNVSDHLPILVEVEI